MRQKTLLVALGILLAVSACVNIVQASLARRNEGAADPKPGDGQEEYVYVAVFRNDPMIKVQDEVGLKRFAQEYGVKVSIEAPERYDAPAQARILADVIARRPSGIMICATDPLIIPYINQASEMGIPIITVDADQPDSKRLAFVGSDWTKIGQRQAEAMVKLIGGKGEVAMLGMVGSDNMQHGFAGFRSVMANYPDVYVYDEFDDMSNVTEAQRITEKIIDEHPRIAGIAGFDSNSGPGIAAALKKHGLVGKVKVTCMDIAPIHLELLRNGLVQKLIGQKRELFTYYGGKLLYDINHSNVDVIVDGDKYGIINIPDYVDTGLVEVDLSNVDRIVRD